MNEKVTKAMQCAETLMSGLKDLMQEANGKNDALWLLGLRLQEDAAKIVATLAQLENV
jgi:hypothetical protein